MSFTCYLNVIYMLFTIISRLNSARPLQHLIGSASLVLLASHWLKPPSLNISPPLFGRRGTKGASGSFSGEHPVTNRGSCELCWGGSFLVRSGPVLGWFFLWMFFQLKDEAASRYLIQNVAEKETKTAPLSVKREFPLPVPCMKVSITLARMLGLPLLF